MAGLESADRVVSVDGQAVKTNQDWFSFRSIIEINRPFQFEIERNGRKLQADITFKRRAWTNMTLAHRMLALGWQAARLLLLIPAFVIGFGRPRDHVALLGALCLATIAILPFDAPIGRAAVWRQLPALGMLLWIPYICILVPGAIAFTFFASFPRKLFHARWAWALVWMPALLQLPWLVFLTYSVLYRPEHMTGARGNWALRTNVSVTATYFMSGIVAFIVNYRNLKDINERRRVRVLAPQITARQQRGDRVENAVSPF